EQSRKFVLVVDDTNTVRLKYVTPAQLDGGLRVIKDGVAANDRVVVNGLMRARPGAKVTPQEEGTPAAPSAANEARKNGAQTKADNVGKKSRCRLLPVQGQGGTKRLVPRLRGNERRSVASLDSDRP